jgi:hypothetical protein
MYVLLITLTGLTCAAVGGAGLRGDSAWGAAGFDDRFVDEVFRCDAGVDGAGRRTGLNDRNGRGGE